MIRKMVMADIPRVAEIHTFGWRCAYRGIVHDDHLFNKMLVAKRMTIFEKALISGSEDSYIFDDGIIKAILTIGKCRDNDKPASFELWGIYVESLMKKQGIGSKMVAFCEEKAIEQGFREICLWVLEKNIEARVFYENLGYMPDGESKFIDFLGVREIRYFKII